MYEGMRFINTRFCAGFQGPNSDSSIIENSEPHYEQLTISAG
jgi:hypothetical protein